MNTMTTSLLVVFTLAIWPTLMTILLMVTVIQVCLTEMWTGVVALPHHSGLGLTFSRISHITDCTLFCRSSFSLFFCLFYIITEAFSFHFKTDTSVQSSAGHDWVPTLFMWYDMYVIVKHYSQFWHDKIIIQRRISSNTKVSVTKSGHIMMRTVIPWSRCVTTDKHRYCTPNDKLTPHWNIPTQSEQTSTISPLCHKIWCCFDGYFLKIFFQTQ